MNGFQNNVAHLFSSMSKSAISNFHLVNMHNVGACVSVCMHASVQISTTIISIYIYRFPNNVAQLFSSENFDSDRSKVKAMLA